MSALKPRGPPGKRFILVTGPPRSGKTTLVARVVEELKRRNAKVGGLITREIRDERGVRVGFALQDLLTGRIGTLAHVEQREGPRVGKYVVNLEGLREIGAKAILTALREAELVVVDEVGPMELLSPDFAAALEEASGSDGPLLATVHYHSRHPLVRRLKSNPNSEVFTLSSQNREAVLREILSRLSFLLSR